jgi:hypothetical protein
MEGTVSGAIVKAAVPGNIYPDPPSPFVAVFIANVNPKDLLPPERFSKIRTELPLAAGRFQEGQIF